MVTGGGIVEAKIQQAIKVARERNKGKIVPSSDIYEAIYKAGQKSVVDWIESNDLEELDGIDEYISFDFLPGVWHKQLKEWGI